MPPFRRLLLLIPAALVGAAAWMLFAWLCRPQPLWREEVPDSVWLRALSPDGQTLLLFESVPAARGHGGLTIHGRVAANGRPLFSWRRPAALSSHIRTAFSGPHLLRMLNEGDAEPQLSTLDLRTGDVTAHAIPGAVHWQSCLAPDGSGYWRFRREAGKAELVEYGFDDEKVRRAFLLPADGAFSRLEVSADGVLAVWLERDPAAGNRAVRLWQTDLRSQKTLAFELTGHEGAAGDPTILDAAAGLVAVEHVEFSPPPQRFSWHSYPLFDTKSGGWLKNEPGLDSPYAYQPGPGGLVRALFTTRTPAAWPRWAGSGSGAIAFGVWRAGELPPAAPSLLVLPKNEDGRAAAWLDADRLAISATRTDEAPTWRRRACEWLGLGDLAETTYRFGVRVYNLKEQAWEWERFGPPVPPNVFRHSAVQLGPNGLLALQRQVRDAGNLLEVWDYPPAGWRSWLPLGAAGMVAAMAWLGLRRRFRPSAPPPTAAP